MSGSFLWECSWVIFWFCPLRYFYFFPAALQQNQKMTQLWSLSSTSFSLTKRLVSYLSLLMTSRPLTNRPTPRPPFLWLDRSKVGCESSHSRRKEASDCEPGLLQVSAPHRAAVCAEIVQQRAAAAAERCDDRSTHLSTRHRRSAGFAHSLAFHRCWRIADRPPRRCVLFKFPSIDYSSSAQTSPDWRL